jgi:hypothetical protein
MTVPVAAGPTRSTDSIGWGWHLYSVVSFVWWRPGRRWLPANPKAKRQQPDQREASK